MTRAGSWEDWKTAGFCSASPQPAHSQMYRWTDTWTSVLAFDPHNEPVYDDLDLVQESANSLEMRLSQDTEPVGAELGFSPRLATLWPNILFPIGLVLSQDNPR